MENSELLLSLCVPTNGVTKWIIPLVESIYSQGANNSLFEVVITDNGGNDELEKELEKISYGNLHYYRTTSKGFTNQIDAFEKCNGLFCKMLNHRTIMLPGSIEKLCRLVKKYKDEKPILYCTDGRLKGDEIIECSSVDEFVKTMGIRSSWSGGTGAWKKDLEEVEKKFIDRTFPHTVFLFELREDSKYIIWNGVYHKMQDETGKGGYNVFLAFGVTFLDIISRLRYQGRITSETFASVKKDIFKFMKSLYLKEVIMPSKNTFITDDIQESVSIYYGTFYYYKMIMETYLEIPLIGLKSITNKIYNITHWKL